jgi:hypothetical protein
MHTLRADFPIFEQLVRHWSKGISSSSFTLLGR